MRRKRFQRGCVRKVKHGRRWVWIGKYYERGEGRTRVLGHCSDMTEGGAWAKLQEYLLPLNEKAGRRQNLPSNFRAYVENVFLPQRRKKWKDSTDTTTTERIRKHLLPAFGDFDLTVLSRDRLQDFLDGKTRSGLSKSVVSHLRWDLNAIFKMAAEDTVVQGNAAGSLVTPRGARDEAQRILRERLGARDNNSLDILRKGKQIVFDEWADHFLEHYSKPPIRSKATHVANQAALRTLRPAFGTMKLADINSPMIEEHLRSRLGQRRLVHRREGICELGIIKPTTVHQEFRVLRRIFAVAVKKRLVTMNPCSAVEFPVRVKGLFRPHYVTWSEQTKIEAQAPDYLKNVIRIITETGLRVYKELAPVRKEQIDLSNKVVFISDSKTTTGIAEVPLTDIAVQAFRSQLELAGPGPWLFPSDNNRTGHQTAFKKVWSTTLRKAGVQYFRLYDLRSTYATRLSAGGVADEWVTQMLRQTDAQVFKRYSQMKLQMKREALQKLNRKASEADSAEEF